MDFAALQVLVGVRNYRPEAAGVNLRLDVVVNGKTSFIRTTRCWRFRHEKPRVATKHRTQKTKAASAAALQNEGRRCSPVRGVLPPDGPERGGRHVRFDGHR